MALGTRAQEPQRHIELGGFAAASACGGKEGRREGGRRGWGGRREEGERVGGREGEREGGREEVPCILY